MTPHFARELEQRRRDLLNPPHWAARRRKREGRKAATSSGIPSIGVRLNVRRADPLDALALTPLQREAADYWRTLAETPYGAPQAGVNASQLLDLRVYAKRRTPLFTYDVAHAVVIERRTISEAALTAFPHGFLRRGGAGRAEVKLRVVVALDRVAACLMEETLYHTGSL